VTNGRTIMKRKSDVTGTRAFGFRRTKRMVAIVSLLAAAAALGGVPASAAPNALPIKALDLRPPDPQDILLTGSPQVITSIDATDALIDADSMPDFVIVGAPPLPEMPEMQSDIHVPQIGFGSLYWALQHPTGAWRILLPEQ
jgi:hypothetical protein